ncbi:ferredoxin--NADP reductase [Saccharopolyspora cebuensis]|uniref:Ferredoxin--NADP reductase n=1 Tax=Saccharopolyspora cebuensis TaxID=418759 RepID=A0ABV4CFQ6_9PSEU
MTPADRGARSAGLRARVVRVIQETPDARSFVLDPGDADFDYRPGQFVTVRIPGAGGGVARCYSLCSSPHRGERPTITVKRTADGYGSNWLCDNVVAGTVLEVLRPAGAFTPDSLDEDVLLLAGGSGITPVMSIAKAHLSAGTGSVALLYANRDERSVIFREELRALADEHPGRLGVVHWLESVQGVPSGAGLRALVAAHADRRAFLCGPEPFVELAAAVLADLGVPAERIRTERFTAQRGDPFAAVDTGGPSGEVEVALDGRVRTVPWPRGATLLEALLAAGIDAPFSCREGACSACACVLLDGEVAMDRNEVLDQRDLDDGLVLACQARPVGDRVRISYDG